MVMSTSTSVCRATCTGCSPMVASMDLVRLKVPPYDKAKHQCLTDADCANPEVVDYPENPVLGLVIGRELQPHQIHRGDHRRG